MENWKSHLSTQHTCKFLMCLPFSNISVTCFKISHEPSQHLANNVLNTWYEVGEKH